MNQTIYNNNSTASTITTNNFNWFSICRVFVTSFGTFTNFLNILVFLNHKLKDTSYTYMLSNSISNFMYLALAFLSTIFMSCTSCVTYKTYFAAFFQAYIAGYCSSVLAFYRITVEILLSFHTYCILINQYWLRVVSYRVYLILLFILSTIIYAYSPFNQQIVVTWDSNQFEYLYSALTSNFGINGAGKNLGIVIMFIRLGLVVVVLTLLNVMNVIEFRRRFNNNIQKIGLIQIDTSNKSRTNLNLGKFFCFKFVIRRLCIAKYRLLLRKNRYIYMICLFLI